MRTSVARRGFITGIAGEDSELVFAELLECVLDDEGPLGQAVLLADGAVFNRPELDHGARAVEQLSSGPMNRPPNIDRPRDTSMPRLDAMQVPRVVLGLLGLSALGLTGALAASQLAQDGTGPRSSQSTPGFAGIAWTEPIEVATGPGYRGAWRMNDSDFHYVDDPTVAIADGGRVAVAWADQVRRDIFFQAYNAAGEVMLEAPVNASRSPDIFSWLPRVAILEGDPNRVYVLRQEIVFSGGSHGGEIFFARSTDGGRSFDIPVNLSGTVAGDGKGRLSAERWDNGSLDLVLGSGGEIHVAWTEYEGALWYRRSTDGGETFAERVHIAGDGTLPARGPSLAIEDGDTLHVAWAVGEDPAADIHLATSSDNGITFGAPTVVAGSDGHADAPKLAVDRDGTVHLVYAEAPPGSPGRHEIRYTRRSSRDEAFEPSRAIAGPDGVDRVGFPSLDIDGENNLYVVWERFPTRNGRPFGLQFARSEDNGRTFGLHSVVPGTAEAAEGSNGGLQGLLMRKIAVAKDGTVAVVNSSFREGEDSRVHLIRGRVPASPLG